MKKAIGVILIVVGSFLLLTNLQQVPGLLEHFGMLFGETEDYQKGVAIGYIMGSLTFLALSAGLVIWGLRLFKTSRTKTPEQE